MFDESDTRQSDDDCGPPIVVYQPRRVLGLVGAGMLVFIAIIPMLDYLGIVAFPCVLYVVLALIVVPLGFMFVLELFRTPYTVGPNGVRVCRRGRWLVYPWQKVAAIWLTTTVTYHEATQSTTQTYSCKLRFEDGSRLSLDGLSGEFQRWIERQVNHYVIPKIQAEWDSGRPVHFGAVSLSRAGIHAGRHLLPWTDVASVNPERNESHLVIREHGQSLPWKELDGVAIPNFGMFSQLVQENIGGQDA